jgi:hypothetical protein
MDGDAHAATHDNRVARRAQSDRLTSINTYTQLQRIGLNQSAGLASLLAESFN